jgi:hypothetical protein
MVLPLESQSEVHVQIAVHCPACDRPMPYIRFDPSADIKQVWCHNDKCPEFGKKWDVNMRNGIARRSE